MNLVLSDSVGLGGKNTPADMLAVCNRLRELGLHWADTSTGATGGLVTAIKLFQAIKNGHETINHPHNDGRVDVGGDTHRWLEARNAPHWQRLEASRRGLGFGKHVDGDQHDFATNWLGETMIAAATEYRLNHLKPNPSAAEISINDAALPRGGPTSDHAGHETGLMCDLRLPRKDGQSGGITWQDAKYDQNAARAMLQAARGTGTLRSALFNDPVLIAEGLCTSHDKHDNHIHLTITVPARLA